MLVHGQFVNRTTELTLGSHGLIGADGPFLAALLESVQLCHYPVRNVAQYVGKVAIGYELEFELQTSHGAAARLNLQLSELEVELLNSQQTGARQARQLSEIEVELLNAQKKLAQQAQQLQS